MHLISSWQPLRIILYNFIILLLQCQTLACMYQTDHEYCQQSFFFLLLQKIVIDLCFLMLTLSTKEALIVYSCFQKSMWCGSYSIPMCNCNFSVVGRQGYYFWLTRGLVFNPFQACMLVLYGPGCEGVTLQLDRSKKSIKKPQSLIPRAHNP